MSATETTIEPPPTPTLTAGPQQDWRCWNCHRLIARLALMPGSIVTIKCRCNMVNTRQVVGMIDSAGSRV